MLAGRLHPIPRHDAAHGPIESADLHVRAAVLVAHAEPVGHGRRDASSAGRTVTAGAGGERGGMLPDDRLTAEGTGEDAEEQEATEGVHAQALYRGPSDAHKTIRRPTGEGG